MAPKTISIRQCEAKDSIEDISETLTFFEREILTLKDLLESKLVEREKELAAKRVLDKQMGAPKKTNSLKDFIKWGRRET